VLRYGVDSSAVLQLIRQHPATRLSSRPASLMDYLIGTEMNPETYEATMYRKLEATLEDSSSTAVTLLVAPFGGGKTQALKHYEDMLMRRTLAALKREEIARLTADNGKAESAIALSLAAKCHELPLYIDLARTPSITPDMLSRQTAEDLLRICSLEPKDLFRQDSRAPHGIPVTTKLQRFRPVWLLDNLGDPSVVQCFGPLLAELTSRFSGRVVAACAEPYIQHVLKNRYMDMFAPVLTLPQSGQNDATSVKMTAAALAKLSSRSKLNAGTHPVKDNSGSFSNLPKFSASLRVFHISFDPNAPLSKLLTLAAAHALALVYDRDPNSASGAHKFMFADNLESLQLMKSPEERLVSLSKLRMQQDMESIAVAAHRLSHQDLITYTPALATCLRNPSMLTYLAVRAQDLLEAVQEARDRAHSQALLSNLSATGAGADRTGKTLEHLRGLDMQQEAPVGINRTLAERVPATSLVQAMKVGAKPEAQSSEYAALSVKVSSKAYKLTRDVLREYFRVALHRFAAAGMLRVPGATGTGAAATAMAAALLRKGAQGTGSTSNAELGLGLGLGGLGYGGVNGLGPLEQDWSTFVDDCLGLCEEIAAYTEDRSNQLANQLEELQRKTTVNLVSGSGTPAEREFVNQSLQRERSALEKLFCTAHEVDLDSPEVIALLIRAINAREAIAVANRQASGGPGSLNLLPEEKYLYEAQNLAVLMARARARNQIEQMRGIRLAGGLKDPDADGSGTLLALIQAQEAISPIYRRLLCMAAPLRSAVSSLTSKVGGNRFVFWSQGLRDFFLTSFQARGGALVARIQAAQQVGALHNPQAFYGIRGVPQVLSPEAARVGSDLVERALNLKRGLITPHWVSATPPHTLVINPLMCGGCRRVLVEPPAVPADKAVQQLGPVGATGAQGLNALMNAEPERRAAPAVPPVRLPSNDRKSCPCCRVYNLCTGCDLCVRCADEVAALERDAATIQSVIPAYDRANGGYGAHYNGYLSRGLYLDPTYGQAIQGNSGSVADPGADTALLSRIVDHLKRTMANSSQQEKETAGNTTRGVPNVHVKGDSDTANDMKSPRRSLVNLIATQVLANALAADTLSPLQAEHQAAQQVNAIQMFDKLYGGAAQNDTLMAPRGVGAPGVVDGNLLWGQPHRYGAHVSSQSSRLRSGGDMITDPIDTARDALRNLANLRGIQLDEVVGKLNQMPGFMGTGVPGAGQPLVTLRCGCEILLPQRLPTGEVVLGRVSRMCLLHKTKQHSTSSSGSSRSAIFEELLESIQPGDTSTIAVRNLYNVLANGASQATVAQDQGTQTSARGIPSISPVSSGGDVHLELAPQLFGDGQRRGKDSLSDQLATAREREERKKERLKQIVSSLGLENVVKPERLVQFIPSKRKAHLFQGLQCATRCAGYLCVGTTEGLHLFDEDDLVPVDVVMLRKSVTALATLPANASQGASDVDSAGSNAFLVAGTSSSEVVILDASQEFKEVARVPLAISPYHLSATADGSVRQIEPHPKYPHVMAAITESTVHILTFDLTTRPVRLASQDMWFNPVQRSLALQELTVRAQSTDPFGVHGILPAVHASRMNWPEIRMRKARWQISGEDSGVLLVGDVEVIWNMPYQMSSLLAGLVPTVKLVPNSLVASPITAASRIALGAADTADLAVLRGQPIRPLLTLAGQEQSMATPEALPIVRLHSDQSASFVRDLALSPDGQYRAVALMHHAAPLLQHLSSGRVIELPAPVVKRELDNVDKPRNAEWISRVSWSPDGTMLLAGGDQGSIFMYRVRGGSGNLQAYMPKAAGDAVSNLLWDRDGNLISLGFSGVMKRWEINPLQTAISLETEVVGDHIQD